MKIRVKIVSLADVIAKKEDPWPSYVAEVSFETRARWTTRRTFSCQNRLAQDELTTYRRSLVRCAVR